ncbi:cuticle collagen 2-like [Haliaeetus albicilla]|uniref:cuticle collagen 2-like n=1 Tax=Haliaeetus albicilla TaxID=8969 RepID=UPI0037E8C406
MPAAAAHTPAAGKRAAAPAAALRSGSASSSSGAGWSCRGRDGGGRRGDGERSAAPATGGDWLPGFHGGAATHCQPLPITAEGPAPPAGTTSPPRLPRPGSPAPLPGGSPGPARPGPSGSPGTATPPPCPSAPGRGRAAQGAAGCKAEKEEGGDPLRFGCRKVGGSGRRHGMDGRDPPTASPVKLWGSVPGLDAPGVGEGDEAGAEKSDKKPAA